MKESSVKLLAKWIADRASHFEDDPDIELLLKLDDIYDDAYKQKRAHSFMDAAVFGYECVIKKVLELCELS
jgi:hypothetical protein